ncbi:hypothetical protein IFT67_19200 [Sphingomonas sp. CFBP 13728]|uniref:hypothetical protein n=1 Tax=Sphingomonas sp. CFBP 13728 TaxID=2775294 RepID=UPI00177B91AF|nr:hypothetical protein [Sphingomonas sp. CFBP 13728]MBD8621047.1 hypothetical protein [Sphingomonas sp. CFBP 13728]
MQPINDSAEPGPANVLAWFAASDKMPAGEHQRDQPCPCGKAKSEEHHGPDCDDTYDMAERGHFATA